MRFTIPDTDLAFDIPDDWWSFAEMRDFRPQAPSIATAHQSRVGSRRFRACSMRSVGAAPTAGEHRPLALDSGESRGQMICRRRERP